MGTGIINWNTQMNTTIWKFPLQRLTPHISIALPEGAQILHFDIQVGEFCIWCAVDPEAPMKYEIFSILGTGDELPQRRKHIGTALDNGFVWHLFQKTR
jgi:hypothetical protein